MPAPTPHISAQPGAFAKTVLMPGDPLRSQFIAETYLENPVLVNNVRGVQGYTGTWKGVPVSVMASGMGIPSLGIYAWELFNFYGVKNIIRVGSAGAFSDELNLRDIVVAQGACTNSNYPASFGVKGTFAPLADFKLLMTAVESAKEMGIDVHVGNILSSDNFYYAEGESGADAWKRMGVLATEMEAAGLYCSAAYAGKRALCLCSISDHLYKSGELTHEERRASLRQMIEIALDVAVKMDKAD